MSDNKFIKHLKGEDTAGSLVEIKNQATPASFGNMPLGTSDSTVKYSDHRGNATVVANGTMCWKINDSALTPAPVVSGDGNDYTSIYNVSGSGLWVNSTYTFPSTGDPNHPVAMIFNPNTKWVLKLCGDNLVVENGNTVDFTLVITIGTSHIITKQFTVSEQANHFCKELVIDFAESNADMIKVQGGSTMRVQLLCGTSGASARIYNGMTVFTVLQRKVDAAVVSNTFANVDEVLRDGLLPNDYFSNAAYITQVEDGDTAYAVFQRDGDDMVFIGWHQPIPDQTGKNGYFLTTNGSVMSWAQLTIADVSGLRGELDNMQDEISALQGVGRYLSVWNCVTGLAETNPPESPYVYRSGDYFLVGTVGTTNYKPNGSSYVIGVASTTVETDTVKTNDIYIYDGTTWKLLENVQREIATGVVNQNPAIGATNPIYDWVGTYAEFTSQAIATAHPDWLCFITDDSAPTAGIYTAAQCDALFARTSDTYTKIESNTLLANKANTDADNFTPSGEDYLTGLSFMGDKFEQLVPINGMSYTAPADGYFNLEALLASISGNRLYLLYLPEYTYMYGNKTASMAFGTIATYRRYVWLPVKKGGVVYVTAESTAASPDLNMRFYYANGADYIPPEYTPVEYIEGTSNVQHIKSCIVPNSGMKLYCKAQITGNTSAFCAFGTRAATYDGAQMNIALANQNVVVDWFGGSDSTKRWTVSTAVAQNDIFELEIENSVATLTKNGTVIGTHTFTPISTLARELYLTGINNNGALGGAGTTGRLYEFKLWDGDGNLILDMQPAKDSANVACLYNTVSQTLYYNQGNGTYAAGPDVNE